MRCERNAVRMLAFIIANARTHTSAHCIQLQCSTDTRLSISGFYSTFFSLFMLNAMQQCSCSFLNADCISHSHIYACACDHIRACALLQSNCTRIHTGGRERATICQYIIFRLLSKKFHFTARVLFVVAIDVVFHINFNDVIAVLVDHHTCMKVNEPYMTLCHRYSLSIQ